MSDDGKLKGSKRSFIFSIELSKAENSFQPALLIWRLANWLDMEGAICDQFTCFRENIADLLHERRAILAQSSLLTHN